MSRAIFPSRRCGTCRTPLGLAQDPGVTQRRRVVAVAFAALVEEMDEVVESGIDYQKQKGFRCRYLDYLRPAGASLEE